ncbi:hypothetical protein L1887_56903 [Cichorium endivia]|nr:hypothetical protein L1887_56903 [Cichorium endivia]
MKFFEVCENASDDDDGDVQNKAKGGGDLGGWDEKKSGPDGAGIPKDDKAKDELKAREEQAALDELLNTYGASALPQHLLEVCQDGQPGHGRAALPSCAKVGRVARLCHDGRMHEVAPGQQRRGARRERATWAMRASKSSSTSSAVARPGRLHVQVRHLRHGVVPSAHAASQRQGGAAL